MRIRFESRISGYSGVAYSDKVKEVTRFRVLHYGDKYFSAAIGEEREFGGTLGLEADGSTYELKPGSKVEVLRRTAR